MNFNLQSMNQSLVATRDQALSVFNHPFSQSHYFLVSNLKNGSFLSPINTHTLFTTPKRFQAIIGCLGEGNTPAKTLRQILGSPGAHQGLACFDGLSAKLVERAGFQYCFASGFSISAARLGLPETGFISYGEMVDQGQQITRAVSIPVIGDACGHTQGRKVVSGEETVIRIKAAVDARKESGSDIVIVARTDSRQALPLEESLWRLRAFADAGADVLFIDALASKEESKERAIRQSKK
ncbi:hypothetical protein ES332_A13G135500v1 [Gossypium tomentosum]|uniref:Isocitrate lyase n=1 Tax=Gossypium tomentosum TaxID=34277 RepID=A0A5D2MJZ0_GOSTO|nr:hypothetical protein ES332_A13G135500v1 [Gossypium tomentosum]